MVRAKKVLAALDIDQFKVVTAHTDVPRPLFEPSQLLTLPVEWAHSLGRVRDYLHSSLEHYNVNSLWVDTFPLGIRGELVDLGADLERVYIARYLSWPDYLNAVQWEPTTDLVRFDQCWVVDHLHSTQTEYIDQHCERINKLSLPLGWAKANGIASGCDIPKKTGSPVWLIAHSMPASELLELFLYAQDIAQIEQVQPVYWVCTALNEQDLPPEFLHADVQVMNVFPASQLFEAADRLFTACGYNTMNETEVHAHKHQFIPFPRRYDDQFLRAARRGRWKALAVCLKG